MNVNFGGLVQEDAYLCGSYSDVIHVRVAFVIKWIGESETSSVTIQDEIILDISWKLKCKVRFSSPSKYTDHCEILAADISKCSAVSIAFTV